ncbi:MAG TPA: hypothetical protein VFS43_02630 [Polyangiaceae bacterium]|nr:hypothetical protein [Polyangiaceae bacterium]
MKRTMAAVRELGQMIESRWRARRYDDLAFAEIAQVALGECPLHLRADPREVLAWVLSDEQMPPQLSPPGPAASAQFGQPPVTAFSTRRFVIDFLFWRDGTTAIHDHAFDGAFQVVCGSSVHGEWAFTAEERVNELVSFGSLAPKRLELLGVGDTRPIRRGAGFVHSLFHMDHPSVSAVVRTCTLADVLQQQYLPPGLSLTSFNQDWRRALRLESLRALRDFDRKGFEAALREEARRQEPAGLFELLRRLPEETGLIVEAARPALGGRVDRLVAARDEDQRRTGIALRRRHVRSPEHRFFLAALANAPDRGHLLGLVSARHPEAPPLETVLRWVGELAGVPSRGDPARNALGLPGEGGYTEVLRYALEGLSLPEIEARVADEFEVEDPAEQREALAAMYRFVRDDSIFKTVVAP